MQIAKALTLAGIFALAIPLQGCFIVADSDPPQGAVGALAVDYTIAGSTDPVLCSSYGVTDAELIVYTSRGDYVASVYAPCSDFTVGVSLEWGLYNADVTLVDWANRARSVTKQLDAIRVEADTELVINVDFLPPAML